MNQSAGTFGIWGLVVFMGMVISHPFISFLTFIGLICYQNSVAN